MSKGYLVRRGGGAGGGGINGDAILHVVAGTGTIITITKGATSQNSNGLPRSTDAQTSDFIFGIKAADYGTYTVSDGTNSTTVTINAAKYYEATLYSDLVLVSPTYMNMRYSFIANNGTATRNANSYTLACGQNWEGKSFGSTPSVNLAPYRNLKITYSIDGGSGGTWTFHCYGVQANVGSGTSGTVNLDISAVTGSDGVGVIASQYDIGICTITEIVFER